MIRVYAAMAQKEREVISERTKAALNRLHIRSCQHCEMLQPFGARYNSSSQPVSREANNRVTFTFND